MPSWRDLSGLASGLAGDARRAMDRALGKTGAYRVIGYRGYATTERALVLSSGTLTGAIDRMEKAGLVRRAPDPRDGRAWRIEPVPMNAKRRQAIEDTLERTEDEEGPADQNGNSQPDADR